MPHDSRNTPNLFFSFFGRHFLVVCIFSLVSLSTVSIVAQEGEAPTEPALVVESAPEPAPEPEPAPAPEATPESEPAPEPDPAPSLSEPESTPESQPESGESSSGSAPSDSPVSESPSSPDSAASDASDVFSSSLTLLEMGDGVIPLLE